eukprot:INCI7066.3.p1 GENE.INCI7066.3~~INCI7066.3.p1  ORF type:complete len:429 (+),score=72.73 INCI7066.3:48-1289(+)
MGRRLPSLTALVSLTLLHTHSLLSAASETVEHFVGHADWAEAEAERQCSEGETCLSGPPAPVFEVSESQRKAVSELRDALELLNNFSHPLSQHTAGGLFSVSSDESRGRACSEAKAVVVSVGGYCKQKGFGGNMWGLGEAFKYALNSGRMLVFAEAERWVYVDPRDCSSRSWGCYFEPVASCSESDLFYGVDRANQGKVPLSAEAHKSEERVVYWDNCRFRMYEKDMVKVDASLQKLFRVPEKFAVPLSGNHEQLNAGWFGTVIDYALRPKPFILQRIEEVKQRLAWNSRKRPTIGLHVRRGEKWTDCGKACERRGLATYMEKAKQWKQEWAASKTSGAEDGGFADVYVATDGDTVMAELLEVLTPCFFFFYSHFLWHTVIVHILFARRPFLNSGTFTTKSNTETTTGSSNTF